MQISLLDKYGLNKYGYGLSEPDQPLLSNLEKLWRIITLGSIFAKRHFKIADQCPKHRFVHRFLGYLESIPALGLVIALIEAAVYYLFHSSDTPKKNIGRPKPINKPVPKSIPKPIHTTSSEPYGLVNRADDCFLIADLQMILNNKAWMDWAEQSQDAPEIWKTIASLHRQGTLTNNVPTIRKMLAKLLPTLATGQQDAQEALNPILDLLPDGYKMWVEINRPGYARRTDPFLFVFLPLTEPIETYFNHPHDEIVAKRGSDGQSIVKRDPQTSEPIKDMNGRLTYEEETIQITSCLQNAAPSFSVQLGRFNDAGEKIHSHYDISPQVRIEIAGVGPVIYNLTSVTNHIGATKQSGHYINYRKVGTQWFQLNDSQVRKVSEMEVLADSPNKHGNSYLLNYSIETAVPLEIQINRNLSPPMREEILGHIKNNLPIA